MRRNKIHIVKMAPRRVVKTINNTKLTIKDVICPICRTILIEPITLPCQHSFCTSCFHLTTITSDTRSYDRVNLLCPLCCIRIGSWLRTASKSKKLINQQLWQTIQQQFPLQVQTKLETVHQNYKKHCIQQQDFQMNSTKAKRNLMDLNDNDNNNNNNHNNKEKNSKITTKEYTCRILCEKIQTNLDDSHRINRSNSIESECLYFKPIDYRHNPPSALLSTTITTAENQQPIKVPTQRPTLNNRNIKIIAPCGQNRLNLDPIQSAFAYYFLFTTGSNNNNTINNNNNNNKAVKRGNKKKLRIDNKGGNNMVAALKMRRSLRSNSRYHGLELQKQKRLEQERSDFELAIKLQEAYNQYKYKTRSCTVATTTTTN